MSKARLIITAVVIEGRSQASVARDYRVSKGWVSKPITRYRVEGNAAFEPRSRRPHIWPEATPTATVDLVVALRKHLAHQGLDAGADTIAWHLEHHHDVTVSQATVYRIIRLHDLVVAEPRKKPKSSYIRFAAEQPNETWQADFTHHRLADGTGPPWLGWRLPTLETRTLLLFVKPSFEGSVELTCDVALEAAPDLAVGLALGAASFDVGLGRWVVALTLDRYDVERAVEVSVAAPVEPVSGGES